MMIRIDARRLTDSAGLHAALKEAFGFPAFYGNNLNALVDCLTHLDDPSAGMSRTQRLKSIIRARIWKVTSSMSFAKPRKILLKPRAPLPEARSRNICAAKARRLQ